MHAVAAHELGKRFNRFHADRPVTIYEAVLSGWRHVNPRDKFWALCNINFSMQPGESLGVIGRNGSGKSTLLKLLSGVLKPDAGRIEVSGRACALLNPNGCFHGDLTGTENALIGAVISGLSSQQAAERMQAIVEFAELEKFIASPVRSYSFGMKMRLALSIAVHADPQLLMIDEALAVADMPFQTKCFERIQSLKKNGCAVILVSHVIDQILQFCDAAMLLEGGQLVTVGEPEMVIQQYRNLNSQQTNEPSLRDSLMAGQALPAPSDSGIVQLAPVFVTSIAEEFLPDILPDAVSGDR